MTIQTSLLELLAQKIGCSYLSDLRFLPAWRREQLAREVEMLPPQDASVFEWNDALCYLTGEGPEKTAEAARNRLLDLLREPMD